MSFDLKIVNNDISLGKNKDVAIVEDEEKLRQDTLKIVLTPLGANIYFPWYGSIVNGSLIGVSEEISFVSSVAESQLRRSIEILQELQKVQAKDISQKVSAAEQIAATSGISVERNVVDPRYFSVFLGIISKSFRRSNISFDVVN